MEIQSIDRGRRPQRVQNAACSAHVDPMGPVRCSVYNFYKCMCVPLTPVCMASALGPLDVRPDFHVHDSSRRHCVFAGYTLRSKTTIELLPVLVSFTELPSL